MADFNHCGIEAGIDDIAELQKKIEDLSGGDVSKYLESAKKIADDEIVAKKIAKRNSAINLKKTLEILDYVIRVYPDKPELGLQAVLVGTNRARKGSRDSIASKQNSLAGSYVQGFQSDIEKTGYWKEFVSGEYDEEIAMATWDYGRRDSISKYSDVAKNIAPVIEKWNEHVRTQANNAGAWIGKQDGYVVRQSHDMYKIRDASRRSGGKFTKDDAENFEAWKEYILPLLDERTFEEVDNVNDFLDSVWRGLATGVHMMHDGGGGSNYVPSGFASLAKRLSHDRVLHFKDGKSWHEYNKVFGSGSLRESMLTGLDRMGKNTAIMQGLGANPKMTLDRVYNTLLSETKKKSVKDTEKLKNKRSAIDKWMAEIDGSVNIPANAMVARFSANVRAIQSMSKLGGALISSVTDLHNAAGEFRYQGYGFLSGYSAAFKGLKGTSSEQRQVLGMIGVTMRGMAGDMVHRFSAEDDLGGKMSRMMRTYFKYNGLTWWTDSLRSGVTLGFSKNLGENVNLPFSKLSDDFQRVMTLFNIDDGMWEMMRKIDLEEADGDKFFTPEMARKIPDVEVDAYLKSRGFKTSEYARRNMREEIEGKFRNYFVDRVEYAVIEPDARVRAISKHGAQSGTFIGEFARFVMQFKSFPTSMILKPLARDVWGRGIEADNFASAMWKGLKSGNGEMMAMAHTIVMSTILGYVAMSAKDMLKGRTPRDPTDPKTWFASASQGGGFGIYGDFIFGEYNRFGNTLLSSMAGPTIGQVDDMADLWTRIRNGDDVGASAFRMLVNNTPFINLFYTRMALDYMILYRMQEAMNPGYLRRMEKRIERENNQELLLRPSSIIE